VLGRLQTDLRKGKKVTLQSLHWHHLTLSVLFMAYCYGERQGRISELFLIPVQPGPAVLVFLYLFQMGMRRPFCGFFYPLKYILGLGSMLGLQWNIFRVVLWLNNKHGNKTLVHFLSTGDRASIVFSP